MCAQGIIKQAVQEASGGDAICGGTNANGATELLPYLRCIMWGRSQQHDEARSAQFRFTPPAPFRWADALAGGGGFRDRFARATRSASFAQSGEAGEIDRGGTDTLEGAGQGRFQDGARDAIGGDEDEIEDW